MHKATYHENELMDMARATENRATRLRKAIEHNRQVREQSRAGNAQEPEPPYFELGPYRFTRIEQFQRGAHARWCVCGWCAQGYVTPELAPDATPFSIWQAAVAAGVPCPEPPSVALHNQYTIPPGAALFVKIDSIGDGRVSGILRWPEGQWPESRTWHHGDDVFTNATPFAIWEECVRKGVPCPDPPSVTLHGPHTGNPYRYARIDTMHTVSDGTALTGWWAGNDAAWNTYDIIDHVVAESPDAIRAACAEKGVPCVGEPKTITVTKLDKRFRDVFSAVSSISAVWHNIEGPCLRIVGDAIPDTHTLTKMDLADIQQQAAEAGIELPEVTVGAEYDWSHIAEVQHHADGTTIFGQVDGEGIHNETSYTPAQVVRLCELAGWPRPEVRMVCTYTNGDPCEVDPADVDRVVSQKTPGWQHTEVILKQPEHDWIFRQVREPVAVVQRMIDACKEGE